MESNQLNNMPSEEAVIEALTLDYKVNSHGTKRYRNKEGLLHRIYGPAVTWPSGAKFWYKNGLYHREDGPAVMYSDGTNEYWIEGTSLSELEFKRYLERK